MGKGDTMAELPDVRFHAVVMVLAVQLAVPLGIGGRQIDVELQPVAGELQVIRQLLRQEYF